MVWWLFDYGGVLSKPQSDADLRSMAAIVGADPQSFGRAYWAHRADYDRNDLSLDEYWARVTGRRPSGEELRRLLELDTESWSHPNDSMRQVVPDLVERGENIALLSNAPAQLARSIEQLEWMRPVSRRFFSCDLRLTKPDPEIYHAVLAGLEAPARDVLFVDDRSENIVTAEELGMRAVQFNPSDTLGSIASLRAARAF